MALDSGDSSLGTLLGRQAEPSTKPTNPEPKRSPGSRPGAEAQGQRAPRTTRGRHALSPSRWARRRSRARLRFVGRWGTAGLGPPIEQVRSSSPPALPSARALREDEREDLATASSGGLELCRSLRRLLLLAVGSGASGLGWPWPARPVARPQQLAFQRGLGHYRWGWPDFRRGRTRRAWRAGTDGLLGRSSPGGDAGSSARRGSCLFSRQSALTPSC